MADARRKSSARGRDADGPLLSVIPVDLPVRVPGPAEGAEGLRRVKSEELLLPEPWAEDREFPALVTSVGRYGVLVPVPCVRDAEERLVVVSGRRRVRAAREVGADVPVFVVEGAPDGAETLTRVFNENVHRLAKRSTIEQGLCLRELMKALEGEGKSTSVRAIAARLGVSVGTVHTWRSVAERFTVEDMVILAEQAGVTLGDVLALPVRRTKALVAASTYREMMDVVRGTGPADDTSAPAHRDGSAGQPTRSWWRRLFTGIAQRVSGWVTDASGRRNWLNRIRGVFASGR